MLRYTLLTNYTHPLFFGFFKLKLECGFLVFCVLNLQANHNFMSVFLFRIIYFLFYLHLNTPTLPYI